MAAARELAQEVRALLQALNERELSDEQCLAALGHVNAALDAVEGPRRPRWYQVEDLANRTKARPSFNEHSLYRGKSSAIAPPMRTYFETEADGRRVVVGEVICPLLYEGPPGGVHGGYVAGLFDDVLGGTQQLVEGQSGLTGMLTVRYRAITPLETPLVLRAWIESVSDRRIVAKATCHAAGKLTAEAEGLFIRVDMGEVAARATN